MYYGIDFHDHISESATHASDTMSDTTIFVPLSGDPLQNRVNTISYPSMEAVFIHFKLAIESNHCVGVQISIVPFCLHNFRGQVFYFAEGTVARCCEEIEKDDILLSINNATETIHHNLVPWHKWNVRAPGFW